MDLPMLPLPRAATTAFLLFAILRPTYAEQAPSLESAASNLSAFALKAAFLGSREPRDLSEIDETRHGYPRTDNNLYCAVPASAEPVVLRGAAAYAEAMKTVRNDPQCRYFQRGPEIDFSRWVLVGVKASVPGCEVYGTKRSVSRSDRARRITIKIEAKYVPCSQAPTESVNWLKVDPFPEGYQVVVDLRTKPAEDR